MTLMEKLIDNEYADRYCDDRPEPLDYNPIRRKYAIEEVLGCLQDCKDKLEDYKTGDIEEKRIFNEHGRLMEALNLYIDSLSEDIAECDEALASDADYPGKDEF